MVRGGIAITNNYAELTLTSGGKDITRVYDDTVSTAVNKFALISATLNDLLKEGASTSDIDFYIDQVEHLLHRAHVELIPGRRSFQQRYNIWLLDGYVRMLLETADIKRIAQLLYIDSMLYAIEEASAREGDTLRIDFVMPSKVRVVTLNDISPSSPISISKPANDELCTGLRSLNKNIQLLSKLIVANKPALDAIFRSICKTACKHLH